MALSYEPKTPLGRFVNELEETVIALLLGIMTLITFTNVVLRYGFNTGLIWGLEMVTFLFAWLVLFGASYAVKVTAHLGVDVVVNLFGPRGRKDFCTFGRIGLYWLCVSCFQRIMGLLGKFCQPAPNHWALVSNGF
jgi:C4-dicarboxylate transporter DctQ subunit